MVPMGGGLGKGPSLFSNILSTDKILNCFYCNARSIKNKLLELHDVLYGGFYNIVCISESWLSPNMIDGILDPSGLYKIYRKDRVDGYGGVCIFVSRFIHSSFISIDNSIYADVELVACGITFKGITLTLCCFYCAPNISCDMFKVALSGLSSVCDTSHICLVVGDFNLPALDWSKHPDSNQPRAKEFLKFCSDFGYEQLINFPTRGDKFLDLVLTNDPLLVSRLTVGPPFSTSDHDSVTLSIIPPTLNCTPSCYNYSADASKDVYYDYSTAD